MFRPLYVPARLFAFGLLFNLSTALVFAQSAPPRQPANPAQATAAETLHTGTSLVIVDVVVEDRDGRPCRGLTRNDFIVTDDKKPQTIRNFEEHTAATAQKPGPPMAPLPPGVFTDYTRVTPGSTLNVLLVDALNTPMSDQNILRRQLLDFVKQEKPGTQVAIFVLTSRLIMLQGFSSDPAVLRRVLDGKLTAHGSPLLNDAVGGGTGPDSLASAMQGIGGGEDPEVAAALVQADADMKLLQTVNRTQYTLDAFNAMAHYLSNFPGRKNILWFSGSFPLSVSPDPALENPFSAMEDSNEEFRETTNLLTRAQVAVYPIDARGLMIAPALQVSDNSGAISDRQALAQSLHEFHESQIMEHATMEQMASDTGGQAFYNTNGLGDAAAKAIDAGSNYYMLAYNPSDRSRDGAYRKIHVQLAGAYAAQGYKLEYRHGYYADGPQKSENHADLATKAAPDATALADHAAEAYSHAPLSRGAPAPSDILFKVGVAPMTGKDDDALAAGNHADASGRMKPPYRTLAIDYVALPREFSMVAQEDGRHTGEMEFTTLVYDADGNLLNMSGSKVHLNLQPDAYKRFLASPVRFHLAVSAPVKQESFLRIIIRDVPANHYGVIEIPAAQIGHLPPMEARRWPGETAKSGASSAQVSGTQ